LAKNVSPIVMTDLQKKEFIDNRNFKLLTIGYIINKIYYQNWLFLTEENICH